MAEFAAAMISPKIRFIFALIAALVRRRADAKEEFSGSRLTG